MSRPSPTLSSVRVFVVLAVSLLGARPLLAQQRDTTPVQLPAVTVTRDVARSPLDLPYALSITTPDSLRPGQTHTDVEQTLLLVPGVTVANRDNPSQDPRISIRGFGSRSAFGVRSIRILRDGMPLTMPDGQTPVDYLDLESVGRVETIRGTASALYGNASGGVIDLRSAPAPLAPVAVQARSWTGSYGLQRLVGVVGGTLGSASYEGNLGRTTANNYRAYSHQRLVNGYGRTTFEAAGTEFELQGMGLDEPLAENPGALTLAQLDSAPDMADPFAVRKRARKVVHQLQLGASAHHELLHDGELSAQVYGGTRALYNPLTYAIVGVDRRSGGAGVRAVVPTPFGELPARLSVGVDAQLQDDYRKNWANCNGLTTPTASCPVLPPPIGVTADAERGKLQLDQQEIVSSVGPYVREELPLGPFDLSGGLRDDIVRFQVRDHYLADGRDDSGTRTMHALSPMLAALDHLGDRHALYVSASSAFETPTTTELGNHPDGSAGLNPDLRPQYSTTYEGGIKGLLAERVQYDAAVFHTDVRHELIPYEVPGTSGRTYYRNAGSTKRNGVELSANTYAGPLSFSASYTYSHFRFDRYLVDTTSYAGNAIPGIPAHQLEGSVTFDARHVFAVAEGVAKSALYVNDANSASAPGYAIMNLRLGGTAVFGWPWLSPVVSVQNVFDRHYVGSVAINASGASLAATKYYEPAPGRTLLVGLTLAGGR